MAASSSNSLTSFPSSSLCCCSKKTEAKGPSWGTVFYRHGLSPIQRIFLFPLFLVHIILLPTTLTWRLLSSTWTLLKKKFRRKTYLSWRLKFVISCIAIAVDPFFCYIPVMDQENKCLGVDITLRNTLLALRSLTDFASVLHIVSHIQDWRFYQDPKPASDTVVYYGPELKKSYLSQKLEATHKRMPWLSASVVIDFIALLPISQVGIVVLFFKMGGSNFFLKSAILNVSLIIQYVPKVFQIYLSSRKLGYVGLWVRSAFYFFFYILAGHVLASFWYLFSIERVISCWYQSTCRNVGCMSTYKCNDTAPKYISVINELCGVDSPNTTVFDFGIYLDILQSGNNESSDFPKKFFYSLWWGIKNLSNFGTNLETSSYVWENCFAILICVTGLLLFLYLIGNVQTYINIDTTKAVKSEEESKKQERVLEELERTRATRTYRDIEMWVSSKGLPKELQTDIMVWITQQWKPDDKVANTVDLLFLHNVLGLDIRGRMMNYLREQALKKVLMWGDADVRQLNSVSFLLEPVVYPENSYIVRSGEKFDLVVYIIEGVIELTNTTSHGVEKMISLQKGDYYGEEALNWASSNYQHNFYECAKTRPISTQDVKCQTKVEALSISADDLFVLVTSVSRYYSGLEMLVPRPPPLPSKLAYKKNMQWARKYLDERIEEWVSNNCLPKEINKEVVDSIKQNILVYKTLVKSVGLGDVDLDVDFVFPMLPLSIQKSMKSYVGMTALNNVPLLETVDVFKASICDYLKPVTYEQNADIVLAGKPIDLMLFIINGVIQTADQSTSGTESEIRSSITTDSCLKKGHFVGGELLTDWASPDASFAELPVSTYTVKCQTKVEAFKLTAEDLKSLVSKFGWRWNLLCKHRRQPRKSVAVTIASTSGNVEHAETRKI